MILLHGTTRRRAELIVHSGPDPSYIEPGGTVGAGGFSTTLEIGPFMFGTPEDYARGKALEFPNDGGPAILAIDVPEEIIQKTQTEWFPLSQGLVQFDPGFGLEELVKAWKSLVKEIRRVP